MRIACTLIVISFASCSTSSPEQRLASSEDFIRLQPVLEGGEFKGYRLYSGKVAGRFACFGFESGDFLQAVNGEALKGRLVVGELKMSDGTLDAFMKRSEALAAQIKESLIDRSKVSLQVQRRAMLEMLAIDRSAKKKCRD